jgi:hypothetical protein
MRCLGCPGQTVWKQHFGGPRRLASLDLVSLATHAPFEPRYRVSPIFRTWSAFSLSSVWLIHNASIHKRRDLWTLRRCRRRLSTFGVIFKKVSLFRQRINWENTRLSPQQYDTASHESLELWRNCVRFPMWKSKSRREVISSAGYSTRTRIDSTFGRTVYWYDGLCFISSSMLIVFDVVRK